MCQQAARTPFPRHPPLIYPNPAITDAGCRLAVRSHPEVQSTRSAQPLNAGETVHKVPK